jgi:glycosyltransferase involved in cell wall biosynthesis
LLTSNFPRWSGDSTTPFVLHLAQDLQEFDWHVDVIAPHAPGAARVETLDGVEVRRFRYMWPESQQTVCYGGGALVNLRKHPINRLKLPMLVGAEWASLCRHLASKRYAAVHAHWILPQGFVAGLAPARVPVRLLTVHGGDIFGLQADSLAAFKHFALRRADAVTVNSSATASAVRRLQPAVNPVNIPMGVTEAHPEPSQVARVRGTYRRGAGPLVVFVGRLVDEKGVDDLLEALALLRPRCPDVTAIVVGEGQDRQALERHSKDLGLDDCVTFTGWVAPHDVAAHLAAADVFVAPSRQATDGWVEAQGLTIAEAMMSGAPVIATRVGGIVDAVRDGTTGVLVDECEPKQIADAVEQIFLNPSWADRVAQQGRRLARERFGRRQSAERFSRLIEDLVEARRVKNTVTGRAFGRRTAEPSSDPRAGHRPSRPPVVVVATTFPARAGDGTPEFVLTLARSIRDFDVTVVAPRLRDAAREDVVEGVRVRRVAYFPRRWEGLAADAIMPALRAEKWRIIEAPFLVSALAVATWREVTKQRAVAVHAHWIAPAGLVALAVRVLTGVPYVVTIHGADAYTLRGALAGRLKRIVLGRAAAVLPVSDDIARTLGLADAPVLRMGVDTRAIRGAVGARAPHEGLLVYIGRLVDKKGVDVLLDAVARVASARLEVIGDGPESADLVARAQQLGILDRVCFTGRLPKSQVLAALARAQAVVIPSRVGAGGDMEGTPVVLCEAMAAGVPVVASDLGGLCECIDDGVTGMLVPPADVDALSAALAKVLSGSIDLDAMGRAAASEATRSLDIGAIGAAYGQVLTRIARRPSVR